MSNHTSSKLQAVAAAAGIAARQRRHPMAREFDVRVREVIERGRAVGMSLSAICAKAKVSRATPDRWLLRPPKTVQTLDAMEAAVEAAEQEFLKGRVE